MKNFQPLKLKHKLLFIGSAIAIPALTLISCGTATTTEPATQSTPPEKPVKKQTTPAPAPIAAPVSPKKNEVKEGQPQADQGSPVQQPTETKDLEESKSTQQESPNTTTQVASQSTSTKFVNTKFPAPVKPAPTPTPKNH